ncbi:MAG TPA: LPS assembly protein LptD [Myxococcaceae bacterium]|nr:LPS assembly protein LptD [Myxococcaceae bacterium]
MIPVLLLAAALGAGDGAGVSSLGEVGPVELDAESVTYDQGTEVATARGRAVLRSRAWIIRADELRYHRGDGRVQAQGHVMLATGLFAATADRVEIDLNRMEADLERGQVLQKQNVTPERLREVETPEALETVGDNAVALRGRHIRRVDESRFLVDGLALVPCYCKSDTWDWKIQSRRATVVAGKRAYLSWPVVYVGKAPVFAFPYLSLPLKNRATGLLIPSPNFTGQNGPHVTLPFFLTLGPSHDLTFTPEYFFGISPPRRTGVRGPRLLTEWNYAPSEGTRGRMTLDLLNDRLPWRNPATWELLSPGSFPGIPSARGMRGQGSWQHRQELGRGFGNFVDASVASDGLLYRDLVTELLAVNRGYTRSAASLFRRTEDTYVGLEAVVRQDINSGYRIDGSFPYEVFAAGPKLIQRLPALSAAIPSKPLWGPLRGSVEAELARVAPLSSRLGDEGQDGVYSGVPDVSQGDGVFAPRGSGPLGTGEREALERFDVRPRLAATSPLGSFARATPYLAYRQTLYRGELSGETSDRGYPMAGLTLDSELGRVFGSGASASRHVLSPFAELRWVPRTFGSAPHFYDERDVAVPENGLLQAVVELRQSLMQRRGTESFERAALHLGQSFDLRPDRPDGTPRPETRLAETYARVRLAAARAGLEVDARYDVPNRRLGLLSARANFAAGTRTSLYAEYLNIWGRGTFSLRRTLDSLVGPATSVGEFPTPGRADRVQTAALGVQTGLGNWGLGYGALLNLSPMPTQYLVAQQSISASFTPPCRCFTAGVYALTRGPPSIPANRDYGFSLSIARLGAVGGAK